MPGDSTTPSPKCCHIGPGDLHCADKAVWRIHEQGTDAGDNSYTESCARHVGALLSYAGEPLPGRVVTYMVVPL